MTADSSIIDARAVSETETISRTLTVYDGHAFIGGGRLLPDTLIVKEHGESTAGVEDTDYTVDYTDDLLTIELKGALADATSLDITITRTLEAASRSSPCWKAAPSPTRASSRRCWRRATPRTSGRSPTWSRPWRPRSSPTTSRSSTTPPPRRRPRSSPMWKAQTAPSTATTSGRWARWAGTSTRPAPQEDPLPSWGENLTGAFRVDVTKPVYTPVSDTQAAKFSGHLTVSHKTESEVV